MQTLLARLENRLWRLIRGRSAQTSDFAAKPTNELMSVYQGRFAEIFFSNEDEIVHKWLHYLPIYDKLFLPYVGSNVRFLEIGVFNGGSLRLWRNYFGDDATIFGVDIDPNCAVHDGKYGRVRIGSQDDPQFLKRVANEMGGLDVVLDDGSHIGSHQRASFNALFPLLSENGLYIIEDIHTSYWPHFGGGLRRRGTAIEFLKDKLDDIHRHYQAPGLNTAELMPEIESIQFFDSIAVIKKRKQMPRYNVKVPSPQDAA
jgi:hypothetical protein